MAKSAHFGKRIKKYRNKIKMSQMQLAESAKISRSYVSQIERGIVDNISIEVLNNIAGALGVTPALLMGQSDKGDIEIPQSLRDFALKENLKFETILKLSRIPTEGKEPKTLREWGRLYKGVRYYVEDAEGESAKEKK